MSKTPSPNFTKISESTIKNQKISRNDESNLLISAIAAVSRQLRQGYLRTPRMQEPRRELVLICNLDPHFMIPPPHSSPLAHFTSQKAGGKCHMKARSGGSKKLPYLHPCHPVIFHPTFSAYWAHGPLQTVLHAIFLHSEKQAQVQLGGVSVSVIGLLAHSDVAWGVTWDYQEQCEVILRNATSPDFLHISLDASSHSRSRG